MLILVGESGSGKSTIQKELVNNFGYKTAILSTTRPKRENEVDGVDYNFLTMKAFKETYDAGYFLSARKYKDWWYGIPEPRGNPDNYVIVATPADIRYIKKTSYIKNIYTVYISVPRRDRLIKGLLRGDNIDEVYRRSLSDVGQFDGMENECDEIVVNNLTGNLEYKYDAGYLAQLIDRCYKQDCIN